jgi:hypothetical protein
MAPCVRIPLGTAALIPPPALNASWNAIYLVGGNLFTMYAVVLAAGMRGKTVRADAEGLRWRRRTFGRAEPSLAWPEARAVLQSETRSTSNVRPQTLYMLDAGHVVLLRGAGRCLGPACGSAVRISAASDREAHRADVARRDSALCFIQSGNGPRSRTPCSAWDGAAAGRGPEGRHAWAGRRFDADTG